MYRPYTVSTLTLGPEVLVWSPRDLTDRKVPIGTSHLGSDLTTGTDVPDRSLRVELGSTVRGAPGVEVLGSVPRDGRRGGPVTQSMCSFSLSPYLLLSLTLYVPLSFSVFVSLCLSLS